VSTLVHTDRDRRALATRLGTAGAALGVLAGLVQATVGSRIPEWSGGEADPLPLGLLTTGLSVLALVAARGLRPDPGRRAASATGLMLPALLCTSTVGRLWFVPGLLLIAAFSMVLAAGRTGELVAVARTRWLSVLVSTVGACEVLVALSAAGAGTAVLGVVGGLLLAATPWLPGRDRPHALVLGALGTLPFAVLTWTSLVTPLVAVLGLGLLALDGREADSYRTDQCARATTRRRLPPRPGLAPS
jgi:hypothetical protein